MMKRILNKGALYMFIATVAINTNAQTKPRVVNEARPNLSLSFQNDTTERFISVGSLRYRDFNKNGKSDLYEDYRK